MMSRTYRVTVVGTLWSGHQATNTYSFMAAEPPTRGECERKAGDFMVVDDLHAEVRGRCLHCGQAVWQPYLDWEDERSETLYLDIVGEEEVQWTEQEER